MKIWKVNNKDIIIVEKDYSNVINKILKFFNKNYTITHKEYLIRNVKNNTYEEFEEDNFIKTLSSVDNYRNKLKNYMNVDNITKYNNITIIKLDGTKHSYLREKEFGHYIFTEFNNSI